MFLNVLAILLPVDYFIYVAFYSKNQCNSEHHQKKYCLHALQIYRFSSISIQQAYY